MSARASAGYIKIMQRDAKRLLPRVREIIRNNPELGDGIELPPPVAIRRRKRRRR